MDLEKKSKWVREQVLEMCIAGGGHLASAFSCVEIMVAIYYGKIFQFNASNPTWDGRDRFVLSKGHAAVTLYAILADLGFFSMHELTNYCKSISMLGSHPDNDIPGVEVTTGSLGHGLGVAAGISLAAKMDKKNYKTIVLLGDGECSEGEIWESALFASKNELDNLIGIVDRNQLCVTDFTENCIGLNPFKDKWESFGWNVIEINGHCFGEILNVLSRFYNGECKTPFMVIANTVKGKGISFMENDPLCHTQIPKGEQLELARKELSE